MIKYRQRRVAGWNDRYKMREAVAARLENRVSQGFTLETDERYFLTVTHTLRIFHARNTGIAKKQQEFL